uniref:Uncharacterized protein n=1 Tax=Oryza meridionalis TaxID=40149 RepID=A0A0E0DUG0_9ORYZ
MPRQKKKKGLPSGHSSPQLQQTAVEALVVDIAARVGGGGGGDGEVLVHDVVRDALFPVAARFCFGDGIGERDVRDLQRVLREFELDVVVGGFGGSMLANLVHWWRLRHFFLGSGTESVVSCVEWTLAHLVIQPEIQDKLRREVVAADRHTSAP